MAATELFSHIHKDEVIKICQDLVRYKTVNPPGDEQEAAGRVCGDSAVVVRGRRARRRGCEEGGRVRDRD